MTKNFFILGFIFLFSLTLCKEEFEEEIFLSNQVCNEVISNSIDECKNLILESGYSHCCFVTVTLHDDPQKEALKDCDQISEETYNNIKDYVKKEKEKYEKLWGNTVDFSINCGATDEKFKNNFIKISLLLLSVILF